MENSNSILDESIGLLVTYGCNLSCTYCYISSKKNVNMKLDTAQTILERYLNKCQGHLDIIFLGGETLLAFDMIRSLVEWTESRSWKRTYRFMGSTNGTLLTEEMKEWLLLHRKSITLALSYDGTPSVQALNRTNKYIDLDFFINTWPKQSIQLTINSASVKYLSEGVIYLLEKGATVHPNVAYEGVEWSDRDLIMYGKQLYKLALYYNSHPSLPNITQFEHDLLEYAANIDEHKEQVEVCGAGNGFHVFDINGNCYPCHILSPLVLTGDKLESIKAGLIDSTSDFSDSMCDRCLYSSVCPTCIACNFLYRDSLQKRDRTHCKIMQIEVKAFIKKEVLRMRNMSKLTSADAKEFSAIKRILYYEKKSVK